MKLNPAEETQLITLISRLYEEIEALESQFSLRVGGGDFRARIEYFHDAIRALSSRNDAAFAPGGRLSVEFLAYDLQCLRYIQAQPFKPFTPAGNPSPSVEVMTLEKNLPASARPGRQAKEQMTELYKHYGVLFAAMLKPFAENDYQERSDALHQETHSLNTLIVHMEKNNLEAAMRAAQQLENDALRQELATLLKAKNKNKEQIKKILNILKTQIKKNDKRETALENAHSNYALNQLALFENAKELLKKMAKSGMNLVGKFVESSLAQTRNDRGR